MTHLNSNIEDVYNPFYQFLTDDGTVNGSQSMAVDFSVTAGEFFTKPAATRAIVILQFTVHIHDNKKFIASGYGGEVPRANGIRIILARGSDLTSDIITEFTEVQTIATHGGWTQFGGMLDHIDFGPGDEFVNISFDLPAPVVINGQDDQLFGLRLEDDFSHLVDHTAFLAGIDVLK